MKNTSSLKQSDEGLSRTENVWLVSRRSRNVEGDQRGVDIAWMM